MVGTTEYKIGYTERHITARAAEAVTWCPKKIEFVAVLDGTEKTERSIHDRLEKYRTHGEWFNIPDESILHGAISEERHNAALVDAANKYFSSREYNDALKAKWEKNRRKYEAEKRRDSLLLEEWLAKQ